MYKEILDYNSVTLKNKIIHNCSFKIFKKEIFALLFVNQQGKKELIESLLKPVELDFGNIYIDNKLFNSYSRNVNNFNNQVSYINSKSSLITSISISDNIFLFKKNAKFFIKEKLLNKQLNLLIKEFNLNLKSSDLIQNLSIAQQVIVELLRAYVSNSKLIIVDQLSSFVSKDEFNQIILFIKKLRDKGISFIYIENHHPEIIKEVNRIAIFKNGNILKILDNDENLDSSMKIISSSFYKNINFLKDNNVSKNVVYENKDFNFKTYASECISILDYDNSIITSVVNKVKVSKDIAIINDSALDTMLFKDLSYLDNLCFLAESKVKNFFFQKKYKKSILKEYSKEIGPCINSLDLYDVSKKDLYALVYYRVLIQKPKVVFCIKPFNNIDMYQRLEIIKLIEKFKENNISIVILTVNLSDSLSTSDRLLICKNNQIIEEYDRKQFNSIK